MQEFYDKKAREILDSGNDAETSAAIDDELERRVMILSGMFSDRDLDDIYETEAKKITDAIHDLTAAVIQLTRVIAQKEN